MFKLDRDGDVIIDEEAMATAPKHFVKMDDKYVTRVDTPTDQRLTLKPGTYSFHKNHYGPDFFVDETPNFDRIIDLPSDAYNRVVNEMERFLKPITKNKFEERGYLYKRSTLLEGPHGSGKSVIINRVCQKVIKKGGIVIIDPQIEYLKDAFDIIDSVQPGTFVTVVFEEFDKYFNDSDLHSSNSDILQILDGQIQRNNVMYLFTTNYLHKIPKRILRPGRVSSVVHVPFPEAEARAVYLSDKVGKGEIEQWVEATAGLSIDELSECVKAVKCLDYKLEDIVARIQDTRSKGS